MRYYLHNINYNKTTSTENKTIGSYSTYEQALVAYHRAIADCISNTNVSWCSIMITDSDGNLADSAYWKEIVEEVTE